MPVGEAGYRRCSPAGIGEFRVQLYDAYSEVEGEVEDAITPNEIADQSKVAGECRLMKARNLICNPACAGEKVCGTDGKCSPFPERKSVGTVTLDGLAVPVMMMPSSRKDYSFQGMLPHPAVRDAAEVRLQAGGGDYEPFTLKAVGIPVLIAPMPTTVLETGKAGRFTWTAPAQQSGARVHLRLDVNHHGSSTSWIECDVADTGSFDVPAALVTDLLALGTSGYPTIVISRRSSDATALRPGCVELRVVSEIEHDVKVAGLTSCKEDPDCPTGKTCDTSRQFCK